MHLIYILIILNFVFADYGGGYAGSGLRYGTNAREFSLASALVADRTPAFCTFSNPALLHYSIQNIIGISLQKMSLDRSIQGLSFVKQLPPNAGIGLAILKSGTSNIMGRDRMNNETESFSSHEIEGIMSFGVSFGLKFALGINIKALFTSIYEDYKGNGISGDIGFIFKHNRSLHFGALIKNINASYNWKVAIGTDERSYVQKFPQYYNFGLTYAGFKNTTIFFQEDIISLPDSHLNYRSRIATEYMLKNKFKLRFGLKQSWGAIKAGTTIDDINLKTVLGIGAPLKIWGEQYSYLDYALDPGNVGEGLSHLFSFSIQF